MSVQQVSRLEAFVSQWYHLPSHQTFALLDSSPADSSCYRKLTFRATVPTPLLILYLTPDGKHLAFGVMDLAVEPAVAQRKRQEEFEHLLLSGALLTSASGDGLVRTVVFPDFQCPYCKRFADLVNELTREERARLQIT